jgi:hypothetical protein
MLRDIVEEQNFTEDFDILRKSYPQMDEIHAALTWALADDPRRGKLVEGFPDPTFRTYQTIPNKDEPVFVVLYRFTDTQVFLLGIDRL